MSWYDPANLSNGVKRVFGGEVTSDANPRYECIWMTGLGWVLGNSFGTSNTLKARKRLHLGPVYIW